MLAVLFFVSQVFAGSAQVDFVAHTNMPGVSVEGKSKSVDVAYKSQSPAGTVIEFDVFDLSTGIDKRDDHMREKVFAAKKPGDVKIRFEAKEASAKSVKGILTIKGVSKEVELPLEQSGSSVVGKTEIKLSDYELPRPGFMGVKVAEKVNVSFKLSE